MESKGSSLAFEGHPAGRVNDVEPVGPAGVSALGGVLDIIHKGGHMNSEFDHASFRRLVAFEQRLGRGNQHAIFNVARHLPTVSWMRFFDIDNIERHLILILVIELVERGNLPTEGRSCMASEYQYHRFLSPK